MSSFRCPPVLSPRDRAGISPRESGSEEGDSAYAPALSHVDDELSLLVSETGVPKVSEMLHLLRSDDAEVRQYALEMLAGVVDEAFGEDGVELGEAVRDGGGIASLARLLSDSSAEVQQQALLVLGNLCSDSVDQESATTKRALLACGGARELLRCIYSQDEGTLLIACGALQNLCIDPAWAAEALRRGAVPRLEELLAHEDARVVRYASGALTNLAHRQADVGISEEAIEAVKARVSQVEAESKLRQRAVGRIASAVRAIPPSARARRVAAARRRLEVALGPPRNVQSQRAGDRHRRGSDARSSDQFSDDGSCTSESSARSYFTAITATSTGTYSSAAGSTRSYEHQRERGAPSLLGPGPSTPPHARHDYPSSRLAQPPSPPPPKLAHASISPHASPHGLSTHAPRIPPPLPPSLQPSALPERLRHGNSTPPRCASPQSVSPEEDWTIETSETAGAAGGDAV